jgi:hypothetical protein
MLRYSSSRISSRTIAGSTSVLSHRSAAKNATIAGNASVCASDGTRAGKVGQRRVAIVVAAVRAISHHASTSM